VLAYATILASWAALVLLLLPLFMQFECFAIGRAFSRVYTTQVQQAVFNVSKRRRFIFRSLFFQLFVVLVAGLAGAIAAEFWCECVFNPFN